ncbi:MAG TPA: hypothetical protein DCZ51_14240 [Bacteroidales bacterium]|nr:hypothetical protein [Bacteroidales bacterium]
MKSNLLKYIVLLFLTSFFSCQKDSETISVLIIGKWDWVNSVSPWTGQVSNPQTAGFSMILEFTVDGNLREFRNDTFITSMNYSIEENSANPNQYSLIYGSDLRTQICLVRDSLILNSAYVDGPVSTFIRSK